MTPEHKDLHSDEQPLGLILYLYQKYMQFHHWGVLLLIQQLDKKNIIVWLTYSLYRINICDPY